MPTLSATPEHTVDAYSQAQRAIDFSNTAAGWTPPPAGTVDEAVA
jgi:hypothetical protein